MNNESLDDALVKERIEAIFYLETEGEIALGRGDMARSASCSDEASEIQDRLGIQGITLEQDEEYIEIWQVHKDGKPWLVFHQAEFTWEEAQS